MSIRAIVFGPTGNVGSFVARTAREHGAKIFLAMRDTKKPIPGLPASEETKGGYERIQADLTQPKSIISAVRQTRSTSAFIYLAHQATDHMKASIEALKEGGIDFVVFLSSFTIPAKSKLEDVKSTDRIPYIHARVEMVLEEVFGSKNYVALRAGAFATNTTRWRAGIQAGEVKLESPDTEYDYITPVDMGRVGGIILAEGQRDGQHRVYLYGPKMMKQRDAIVVALEALGKKFEIVPVGGDEGASSAAPDRVVVKLGEEEKRSEWFLSAYDNHDEGVRNIQKYTGGPPTAFREWVDTDKARFESL